MHHVSPILRTLSTTSILSLYDVCTYVITTFYYLDQYKIMLKLTVTKCYITITFETLQCIIAISFTVISGLTSDLTVAYWNY